MSNIGTWSRSEKYERSFNFSIPKDMKTLKWPTSTKLCYWGFKYYSPQSTDLDNGTWKKVYQNIFRLFGTASWKYRTFPEYVRLRATLYRFLDTKHSRKFLVSQLILHFFKKWFSTRILKVSQKHINISNHSDTKQLATSSHNSTPETCIYYSLNIK